MKVGDFREYSGSAKCLLLGGYLVLDRENSALVIAMKPKITSRCTIVEGNNEFLISSYPSGFKNCIKMEEIPVLLKEGGRYDRFIIQSLNIFFYYFNIKSFPSLAINIQGDSEFYSSEGKTGLGSSSAITVSLVGALLSFFEKKDDFKDLLFKLSSLSHTFAQGNIGSCFDISCAIYGSHIFKRPSPSLLTLDTISCQWDNECYGLSACLGMTFYLVSTPFSGSSTPRMVSLFNQVLKVDKEIVCELKECVCKAMDLIKNGMINEIACSLKNVRYCLQKISQKHHIPIVPEELIPIIESVESIKGVVAVVIPGAGGYDSFGVLTDSCFDINTFDHKVLAFSSL